MQKIDSYDFSGKRAIVRVVLKQKLGKEPSREEFADYYKREYEKLASHYKLKLDPDL